MTHTLQMKQIDTEGDTTILSMENAAGDAFELRLNSIDVVTMISALHTSLNEVVDNPKARSPSLPGMRFVQYFETEENVYFRVFVGEHLYHEYPVPKNTTLAAELQHFADRVAARQEARVTHPPYDSPSGKQ
jgi:hypothetical protein